MGLGISGAVFNLSAPDPTLDALPAAADAACGPEPPPPPCPGSNPCDPGAANIFDIPVPVDPSGFVTTRTGIPLESARVVLQRSDTKTGPFSALPHGSLEMSASNRRNHDSTDPKRLQLNCPGLHRARTLARILSAKLRGPDTIVTLLVLRQGRHGARPTGLITVKANGKRRGFAFINPRTGRATTLMSGHLRRGTRITAGYVGNARFAPSRARARR